MKLIILAAGKGSRLRDLTAAKPKTMVELAGKPLIEYIINNAKKTSISEIIVVTGYQSEKLSEFLTAQFPNTNIKFVHNNNYDSTNMVASLFCAEEEMNDDFIISYSDIVYKSDILNSLINNGKELSIVIDKDWRQLWQKRMDNPLIDAETLKINSSGLIYEIGQKPDSYDDIEGQYIGLMKFSGSSVSAMKVKYKELGNSGKDISNIYMTDFLQHLIDTGSKAEPEFINGGWVEIDTVEDLENLSEYFITNVKED